MTRGRAQELAEGSGGSQKSKSGAVVRDGGIGAEVRDRIEDGSAKSLRIRSLGRLKSELDAVEAEWLRIPFVAAFAVDNSPRNYEQRCAFLDTHGGGIAGSVGKKSERKAGRGEFGETGAVAKERGRVSSVGVTEGAKLFVIAGDESRAGAWAAADVEESAIDAKTKFGHSVGFVDIGRGKEFGADGAEDLLGSGEDVTVFVAASGDIEEADENAFRAGANGIIEISGNALADERGGKVRTIDLREDGGDGLDGSRRFWIDGMVVKEQGRRLIGKVAQRAPWGKRQVTPNLFRRGAGSG